MKQQTEKSRRRLLKAMAAGGGLIAGAKTLPEKWSSPLVQTTIMPAHATMTTCSIAEGCYNFENFSLYWVGGTGPSTVAYWNVVGCSTEVPPEGSLLVVASASSGDAAALLDCPEGDLFRWAAVEGCTLFVCD